MNAQRRKEIQKAIGLIESAKEILEYVAEEEGNAFDNLPESIQYSERGERMEEIKDNIEDVCSELEDQIENLQDTLE